MKIFPKLSPGDNCLAIKFFRLNPPALLYAFFPRISHRSFIVRRPPFRPVSPPHIRNASRLSARGSPASSSPTNHPPECSPHFRPAGSPFQLQEVAPITHYLLQRLPRPFPFTDSRLSGGLLFLSGSVTSARIIAIMELPAVVSPYTSWTR